MKNIFVDCQVNSGKNYKGPNNDLDYFDSMAKILGVTHALVLPTSTHEIKFETYLEQSCLWEIYGGSIRYFKRLIYNEDNEKIEYNPVSPSLLINEIVLKKVKSLNKKSRTKYYFIPIVHPILDTKKDLEQFLEEPETVAVKIHGISAHIFPEIMPTWIGELVNSMGKVMYIHTDYLRPEINDPRIPEYLRDIISKNTPESWLNWCLQNKIDKIHLSHLVRLDYETINRINELDNVVVGIGPDFMLQDEPSRLKYSTNNILNDILKKFNFRRLVYSTDFAYNIKKRPEWGNLDWNTKNRLIKEANNIGLSLDSIENILGLNAINFFNLMNKV